MIPVSRPCAVRADVAQDAEALADDARDRLHDLGQVAARLALDDDRGDEELEVERVDALGQVDQRLLDVETEVLLVERDARTPAASGSGDSCATSWSAAGNDSPARRALVIRSSASGSCSENWCMRLLFLPITHQ